MNLRSPSLISTERIRRFSREIVLATAITLAAFFVFLLSQENTQIAEAPAGATTAPAIHE
jgi:hypothetical protein